MKTTLVFGLGAGAFLESHSTSLRVLVLAALFALGYIEGTFLKLKTSACVTWFFGLAALIAWIVYPLTAVHIVAGVTVLVVGSFLIVAYYRQSNARHKLGGH
jgi:hypothetical protein